MKKIYSALLITAALSVGNTALAEEKHYMMHGSDGPQGHMMEGKKHPKGGSTEHVETYPTSKDPAQDGKHYMMHGSGGPQGHLMEGEKHPKGGSTEHVETYSNNKPTKQQGKHYMMSDGGEGNQWKTGNMMKGNKHPTN